MNPYSPFNRRLKTDMFFGEEYLSLRDSIVEGITNLNELRHSFIVVGGQVMGKSNLLYQVQLELAKYIAKFSSIEPQNIIIPLYMDMWGIELRHFFNRAANSIISYLKPHDRSPIFQNLSNEVVNTFKSVGTDGRQFERQFDLFKKALNKLIEQVDPKSERLRIVFLIDDPFRTERYERAQSLCRKLHELHTEVEHVAYVITSSLHEMNNSLEPRRTGRREMVLAHIGLHRDLQVMSKEDAFKLINSPFEHINGQSVNMGTLPSEVAERIYLACGGHAYLTQFIMFELCRRVKDLGQVTDEHVVEAMKLYDDVGQGFTLWWEKLNETDKRIYEALCHLAKRYHDISARRMSREQICGELGMEAAKCEYSLRVLSTAGLIRKDAEQNNGFYTIAGEWPAHKFLETR